MGKSQKGSNSDRSDRSSDGDSNWNVEKRNDNTTPQNRQRQLQEAAAYEQKYLDNLLKIPPNWAQANRHGKKSHVGRVIGDLKESNNQSQTIANIGPEKQMYPLCIRYKDVKECGSGIPLLYQFKLWTILIYVLMLIPCVYALVTNFSQNPSDDNKYTKTPSWILNFSLGNFGKSKGIDNDEQILMNIQVYLHMATIVAIALLSICLKGLQKKLQLQIDENAQTPNDYAIYLRNVPLNQDQNSVKQWVEKEWGDDHVEVEYANMIYDVGNLINANRNLTIWRTKHSLYNLKKENNRLQLIKKGVQAQDIQQQDIVPIQTRFGCCSRIIDYKQIKDNVDKYQKQIKQYYADVNVDEGQQKNIGKLFIVFKNQRDVRLLDEKYDQSIAGKIWFFMVAKFCCRKTVGYPEYQFQNQSGKTKTKRIYLSRAPQPTDVYWQNLGVTQCQRFSKILVTYSLTVFILAIKFGISFGLNKWNNDKKIKGTQSSTDLITVRGVSFMTSIIVVFFNNLLIILIRKFTASQKHETHTKYNLSVAFKMTVATFVNSAIIPIVVNLEEERWFVNGGLVIDIFFNFISISFITPVLYVFDTFFIIRCLKRCSAQRKGQNSKLTQKQANQLMEGPPVDMARRNSNTFLLFMMAIFYAPLQPLVGVFAIFGASFTYWVDKCILLRRHKQPPAVGPEITFFYGTLIPWALLLYAFSTWFWVFRVGTTGANTPAAILCFVLFGFLVFPIRSCMNCCFRQNAIPSRDTHQQASKEFLTDYRYQNPVTRAQATAKLLEEKYGMQLIPEQNQDGSAMTEEQRKQKLKALKRNQIFKSCMAYGNNRKGLSSEADDLKFGSGPQASVLFELAQRRKKNKESGKASGLLGALLAGNMKQKEDEKEKDQQDAKQSITNQDGAFLLMGVLNPSMTPSTSKLNNNIKTFKKQATYRPPAPLVNLVKNPARIGQSPEQQQQQQLLPPQIQQQSFQPGSYHPPSPSQYVPPPPPPPSHQQIAGAGQPQPRLAIQGYGYGQPAGYGGYGNYLGGYNAPPQYAQQNFQLGYGFNAGYNAGYNSGGYGGYGTQQPYYR